MLDIKVKSKRKTKYISKKYGEIDFKLDKFEKRIIFILVILTFLLGFFSKDFMAYFAGMWFMFFGFLSALEVERGGLFCLLGLGVFGMPFMVVPFTMGFWDNPIFNDGFNNYKILLIISAIMFCLFLVTITLYNISASIRRIKRFVLLPFIFFFLGVLFLAILTTAISLVS